MLKKRVLFLTFIFSSLFNIVSYAAVNENIDPIVIGDDVNYPPYSYIDEHGNPNGFNIDLMEAVSEAVGLNVEFKLNTWNNTIKHLENNEIDIISGMFHSSDRENRFAFTSRHSVASGDIFTRNNITVASIEDLNNRDVIVQSDDIIHEFLSSANLNINLIEVSTAEEALRLISSGEYDYAAVLKLPAHYIIKDNNLANLKSNGLTISPQDYAIAVHKDNDELLSILNEGLAILKSTGEYDKIYNKWLGVYEEKNFLDELSKYSWIIGIFLGFLVLLLSWSLTLKKAVASRTDDLLKANKELLINKEELTASNEELEALLDQLGATEKELRYFSFHDQLTGLYNRRFFEQKLEELDTDENLPLSVIMADVNGLKLVNDAFGHKIGDQLLKKVALIFKKSSRSNDIVARLGGDEFVILLPNTTIDEAEEIINSITNLTSKQTVKSLNISLSFGSANKKSKEEDIQEILKEAEDYMYKRKLYESPSNRSKTIGIIINTLHEKNKREEQHSHRVSKLCMNIGIALSFSSSMVQELKTVGLLHDIGKVAIDEAILNKPGQLTDDEWEEIRRHPEIGYRILSTVNDMSEMAEFVLAHHERWDGKGYPKGLKSKEIPIQARIIAIADTYDAMTSSRSYREPLSKEESLNEIKRCAGSQFDPYLVDIFVKIKLD